MAKHKEEKYELTIGDFQKEGYQERNGFYVHPNITNLEEPIYRYMKLEHLITMLNTKELYIPHRSSFSDLSEMGIKYDPKNIGVLLAVAKNEKTRKVNKKMIDEFNRIRQASKNVCVSSWTSDLKIKDNVTGENFLMWKAYGGNDISCRIETTTQKLIDAMTCIEDTCVLLAKVEYAKESNPDGNAQKAIFWKPPFYEGEQEVRLCVLNKEKYCTLKINPQKMITEIVMSPFINYYCSRFLTEQLKNYFSDITIRRSNIMEYK